jgi:hypothetical protein
VHLFWSSHEEKQACVSLSMQGAAMAGVEAPCWPWGAHRRGKGRGGAAMGVPWGGRGLQEGGAMGTQPATRLSSTFYT